MIAAWSSSSGPLYAARSKRHRCSAVGISVFQTCYTYYSKGLSVSLYRFPQIPALTETSGLSLASFTLRAPTVPENLLHALPLCKRVQGKRSECTGCILDEALRPAWRVVARHMDWTCARYSLDRLSRYVAKAKLDLYWALYTYYITVKGLLNSLYGFPQIPADVRHCFDIAILLQQLVHGGAPWTVHTC